MADIRTYPAIDKVLDILRSKFDITPSARSQNSRPKIIPDDEIVKIEQLADQHTTVGADESSIYFQMGKKSKCYRESEVSKWMMRKLGKIDELDLKCPRTASE